MSYELTKRILRETPSLRPADRLVLATFASFCNGKPEAWPSNETLAAIVGITERNIRKHIERLTSKGYLSSDPRSGLTSVRRVTLPRSKTTPVENDPRSKTPGPPGRKRPPPPVENDPQSNKTSNHHQTISRQDEREGFLKWWNEDVRAKDPDLPKALTWGDARLSSWRSRLREDPDLKTKILAALPVTEFAQKFVTPTWLSKPVNLEKFLEGTFTDPKKKSRHPPPKPAWERKQETRKALITEGLIEPETDEERGWLLEHRKESP